jgi:hypothetical protein
VESAFKEISVDDNLKLEELKLHRTQQARNLCWKL